MSGELRRLTPALFVEPAVWASFARAPRAVVAVVACLVTALAALTIGKGSVGRVLAREDALRVIAIELVGQGCGTEAHQDEVIGYVENFFDLAAISLMAALLCGLFVIVPQLVHSTGRRAEAGLLLRCWRQFSPALPELLPAESSPGDRPSRLRSPLSGDRDRGFLIAAPNAGSDRRGAWMLVSVYTLLLAINAVSLHGRSPALESSHGPVIDFLQIMQLLLLDSATFALCSAILLPAGDPDETCVSGRGGGGRRSWFPRGTYPHVHVAYAAPVVLGAVVAPFSQSNTLLRFILIVGLAFSTLGNAFIWRKGLARSRELAALAARFRAPPRIGDAADVDDLRARLEAHKALAVSAAAHAVTRNVVVAGSAATVVGAVSSVFAMVARVVAAPAFGMLALQAAFLLQYALRAVAIPAMLLRGWRGAFEHLHAALARLDREATVTDRALRNAFFLRYVAHEVRVPLSAIAMGSSLVEEDARTLRHCLRRRGGVAACEATAATTARAVGRSARLMRDAAAAMETMLTDVLTVDKMEQNKFSIEPRACDPSALADQAVAVMGMKAEADGRRVSLRRRVHPSLRGAESGGSGVHSASSLRPAGAASPTPEPEPEGGGCAVRVLADATRLGQVVSNFVSNALKFCEAEVAVSVHVLPAAESPREGAASTTAAAAAGTGPAALDAATPVSGPASKTHAGPTHPARTVAAAGAPVTPLPPSARGRGPSVLLLEGSGPGGAGDGARVLRRAKPRLPPAGAEWAAPVSPRAPPHVRVVVTVCDDGRGLTAAEMNGLFRPFAQIQAGVLQRGGGTGLGLAISRTIVALHGGRVGVWSDGHGRGATFWFEVLLPACPQSPAGGGRGGSSASAPGEGMPREGSNPSLPVARGAAAASSVTVDVVPEGVDLARLTAGDGGPRPSRARRCPQTVGQAACGSPESTGRGEDVAPLASPVAFHPAAGGAPARGLLRGVRVAIVDDSAATRRLLARALERRGAAVGGQFSGPIALWRVLSADAAARPDALVTDQHMPEGLGSDMVRGLRAAGHDFVIVGLSGDEEGRAALLASGASAVHPKPPDVDRLAEEVARLVSEGRDSVLVEEDAP